MSPPLPEPHGPGRDGFVVLGAHPGCPLIERTTDDRLPALVHRPHRPGMGQPHRPWCP